MTTSLIGIRPKHLLDYVITPTLKYLQADTPVARALLLLTAVHESQCGHYLRQEPSHIAIGIFQMEKNTHDDIWKNWLNINNKPNVVALHNLIAARWPQHDAEVMCADMGYAAAMTRAHYLRCPAPLPPMSLDAIAKYWDDQYNRNPKAGFPAQAIADWKNIVGDFNPTMFQD